MSDPADRRSDPGAGSRPGGAAVPVPAGWLAWLPWLAAGALALVAGMLWTAYLDARSEAVAEGERAALAAIEIKSLHQTLEAERILNDRRLADLSMSSGGPNNPAEAGYFILVPPTAGGDAAGVVVWNPRTQEGILTGRRLAVLPADRRYQVWLGDARTPPWPAGTFAGSANGSVRFAFKSPRAAGDGIFFQVTIESAGGASESAGPVALTSQ